MGAREARHVAAYIVRNALAYAREGKYGKAWAQVRKAREFIAAMDDRVASRLAKRAEAFYVKAKDTRRFRVTLAELAEYLA